MSVWRSDFDHCPRGAGKDRGDSGAWRVNKNIKYAYSYKCAVQYRLKYCRICPRVCLQTWTLLYLKQAYFTLDIFVKLKKIEYENLHGNLKNNHLKKVVSIEENIACNYKRQRDFSRN